MSKKLPFGLDPWRFGILMACMAGVFAGIVAIYAVDPGERNGQMPDTAKSGKADEVQAAGDDFKKFAKGDLAAFLVSKDGAPVYDVAFRDEDGKERNLSDWRGRVVLLNLWATWCAPCRKEMPQLAELQRLYGGDDFEVVALSIDRKGAAASAKFLIEAGSANLKLYIDKSAEALEKLQARGLPATYLIDRQGNEIGRLIGPAEWASQDARDLIEAALAQK